MLSKAAIFKALLIGFNITFLVILFYALTKKKDGKFFDSFVVFCLAVFASQYFLYADMRYIEPNWIQVEKVKIVGNKFQDEAGKLRIVQISDLHIKRFGFRERSLIAKVNALKPDIILITGDYVVTKFDLPAVGQTLSKLKAKIGIYGILGDIDYWAYGHERIGELKTVLNNSGVRLLDDESVRIPLASGNGLWIVGLSEETPSGSSVRSAFGNVDLSEPKIVLVHSPEIIDSGLLTSINSDLVLAGDTHGFQTGLRWIQLVSVYANETRYIKGLFRVNDVPMYVNRGIGTQHKNIRFLCRPEITVIKLTDESS